MVRALSLGEPRAEEEAVWRWEDARLPLRVRYYVTDARPPEELVVSVRGVVFHGATVLVCRNRDASHALPGGRREPGEAFEETLRREVLEESGYRLERLRSLGITLLRHLAPKPPGYPWLHPEFLWAVYAAESDGVRVAEPDGEYEDARFLPLAEALALVGLGSRVYVAAAAGLAARPVGNAL